MALGGKRKGVPRKHGRRHDGREKISVFRQREIDRERRGVAPRRPKAVYERDRPGEPADNNFLWLVLTAW